MTFEEMTELKPGDRVRHKTSAELMIVMSIGDYGRRVTVARSTEITNPEEWVLIEKEKK